MIEYEGGHFNGYEPLDHHYLGHESVSKQDQPNLSTNKQDKI